MRVAAQCVALIVVGTGVAFFITACKQRQPVTATSPTPAMKPAPPTPMDIERYEIGGPRWDPAWDKIVELALPAEMLAPRVARDVRPFCPRFSEIDEADKRAFWAYFFQALAGAEAGLKPTSQHVTHNRRCR